MASPERRHTGLRVALATALGFSGAAGAVLAGKAILEGTSRQPVSASENQEGGIMPSAKTFNELVTQTPFPITPTVTETPTQEPTASNTPTGTATKPASTATGTATATEVPPTKIPATATTKPTEVPVRPSPAPTPEPAPQPKVEPKPEAPSAAFPKEIGNLERDGVMIHNRGSRVGVIDNREDPQNNWAAIVAVYKQYAPNDKFEFFFYDNPNDVPQPETLQTPYKYDPTLYWERVGVPGVSNGRTIAGQTADGVWQAHSSLPFIKPEDQNQLNSKINRSLNRGIVVQILTYSFRKNDLFAKQPPEFSAILRQQAIPASSDKTNFSLKVVYK